MSMDNNNAQKKMGVSSHFGDSMPTNAASHLQSQAQEVGAGFPGKFYLSQHSAAHAQAITQAQSKAESQVKTYALRSAGLRWIAQELPVHPPGLSTTNTPSRMWNLDLSADDARRSAGMKWISPPGLSADNFGRGYGVSTSSVASTKRGLELLYGPDGELPQKLRNLEPRHIEQISNEIMDRDTNVGLDDIAGLERAKKCATEMAIWPLLRPDIFKGCRSPGRGLLLFGPPVSI